MWLCNVIYSCVVGMGARGYTCMCGDVSACISVCVWVWVGVSLTGAPPTNAPCAPRLPPIVTCPPGITARFHWCSVRGV